MLDTYFLLFIKHIETIFNVFNCHLAALRKTTIPPETKLIMDILLCISTYSLPENNMRCFFQLIPLLFVDGAKF